VNAVGAQSAYATWRDIGAAGGPIVAGAIAGLLDRDVLYGALAVWMLTWTKSRAAALIAWIGRLDGHRRAVI